MKSWIQDYALQRLLRSESVALKEIIPDGVEPNLFSYHLKQLIADKYVMSPTRGIYTLTAQGHAHVGSLSTKTFRSAPSPKSVVLLYAKNDDKLLFWRWSRQPYLGKVTFPHTRISIDQDIGEALGAALEEKLSLPPDTSLTFRTTGMIRIYTEGVLVSHMNA